MCVAVAGVAQLYLVMSVAASYMLGCIFLMPYRAKLANTIEILTGISIIYASSFLTWYADRDDGDRDTEISIVAAVLSLSPLLAAVIGVVYLWRFGARLPYTEKQRAQASKDFEDLLNVSMAFTKISPDQGSELLLRLQEWDRHNILKGVHIASIEIFGADSRYRISDKTLSAEVSRTLTSGSLDLEPQSKLTSDDRVDAEYSV